MKSIACIIPTYNAGDLIDKCLISIIKQTLKVDLYIVDSSSSDLTVEISKNFEADITIIPSIDFNHGGTRQMMASKCSKYDFLIFMTQDAYLYDNQAFENIIKPFSNFNVAAVCGRQIPHINSNIFASHARNFNYPNLDSLKSISDAETLGLKAIFLSNSFAAYRVSALNSVGGFPTNTIFGEDMFVAAKLLANNYLIAYASCAKCYHSHNYSLIQDFRRYFDLGVFHNVEPWLLEKFGGAGSEGFKFVLSELRFISYTKPILCIQSIIRNCLKFVAYNFGKNNSLLPIFLKKILSMNKQYWEKG